MADVTDTRPDPTVVGHASARLYAQADAAGVPREAADRWFEYLYHANPHVRVQVDRVFAAVIDAAKPIKPAAPPEEGVVTIRESSP